MSLILVLVLSLTMALVSFGALYLNSIQDTNNIFGPIDEDRLCREPHTWHKASFVNVDDELTEEPKIETFCLDCGFIAGSGTMVNPFALKRIQDDLERLEISHKFREELTALEDKWIDAYIQDNKIDSSKGSAEVLKMGFYLYAKFLDNLPALVMAKHLDNQKSKFLAEIKSLPKTDAH